LNLFAFTNVSNAFEDKIKALQAESNLSGDDFLSLAVSLDELIKLTQIIDQLNQRISPNNAAAHAAEPTQAPRKAMAEKLHQFAQDLAKRQYKQVKVSTQDLEQTTSIPAIDNAIRDIAIQILRNAVVHGIETPSLRSTKKKNPTGHVQIHLQQTESQAQLTIEDDGQGINYDAIRERAVAIGLYSAKEIAEWDNRKLLGLLFSSGFSTYGQTDEDAGRGVGLDMVKDRVQKLGGKIGIHSQPNQFTRFSFTFPLNP
jgi:two-component system chemotaxis sensor kinase CheA